MPRLFDIRRPSAASTVVWMITSLNGISPISSSPLKIIRFSQSRMISRAVVFSEPGYQASSSGVSSGQPRIANGQSADENQVSSTSSLRVSSVEPHSAHASGSVSSTVRWPFGHSQTGSWWPHQIWREMFQSGAFSSESIA